MKSKIPKLISFLLLVIIACNTFYSTAVYASDDLTDEQRKAMEDFMESLDNQEKWKKVENSIWGWIMSQSGAIFHGDMAQIRENDEQIKKELRDTWDNPQWRKDNIKIITGSGTPQIQLSKEVSQLVLDTTKKATQSTDNGGYELLKTVPANKVSSMYFSYDTVTKSMYNLLKDNNGIIGMGYQYGNPVFYKIPENLFYVKKDLSYNYAGTTYKYVGVTTYKNLADGAPTIGGRTVKNVDTYVVKDWNDSANFNFLPNSYNRNVFNLYDCFSIWVNLREGLNPFSAGSATYLVTSNGVSIPVFNTVDDAVAYSVANNLYYTSSDYTGEGKEIIITFEEIDKINNGYYDGMYDLLQKLIEQNGGNGLTPEQLQELVDEVQASFGMLKDEINKGFQQQDILIQKNSSILQNIADALNEFFRQTKDFRNEVYNMLKNVGTGGGTGGSTDSSLLKKIYDTVKDGFEDTIKELKKIKRWTAIDTIIDGADAVVDIIQFITDLLDPEKAADAVTEFVATGMDTLSDVKVLIDGKFPFCIPVDILTLMQTLAHEPEPPRFELPIVLERYGIDERLVIDLSEFDYISKISRTFLTISWCFALMNVTTKITDMKSI